MWFRATKPIKAASAGAKVDEEHTLEFPSQEVSFWKVTMLISVHTSYIFVPGTRYLDVPGTSLSVQEPLRSWLRSKSVAEGITLNRS